MSGTIRSSHFPQLSLGPREGWLWAALPADCAAVRVLGDDGIARALVNAGCSLIESPGSGSQALVASGRAATDAEEARRLATALEPGALLAIVAPTPPPAGRRMTPSARALIAGFRRGNSAVRVARHLDAAGLHVWRIDTGNRSARHSIELHDDWRRRPRPSRHPIVLASRAAPPRSAATQARAAAEAAVAAPLRLRRAQVLASGTLMIELAAAEGAAYLLRVAAGGAAGLLETCETVQHELSRVHVPEPVRRRLVAPVAGGTFGLVRWSLEPRVPGRHPRRLGAALWKECLEFLVALRRTPVLRGAHPDGIAAAAVVVEEHVPERDRAVLARVASALDERLASLAPGWCHGDFWTANLLIRGGRLGTVLDWDAATPAGPPLVDLLHLVSYTDRSLRRLPHGARCTRRLWPLARAGGDAAMREYCAATGTPAHPAVLEALAVAYWLSRVARDLRTFADRGQRPQWLTANVREPLRALRAAGW